MSRMRSKKVGFQASFSGKIAQSAPSSSLNSLQNLKSDYFWRIPLFLVNLFFMCYEFNW